MTREIAVFAFLALCQLTTAFGATTTTIAKNHLTADGKTLVTVAIGDDPGTFDPAVYGAIQGIDATAPMIRESLYERDGGVLTPQIAKSYKVDPDHLTYHVEIYDNVYDTAGNHLTADDVVFCFKRAKDNNFNSTSFYDSVTKEGDFKVKIKLNNATVGVFDQVAQVQALYTKKAFDDAKGEFGTHPVFTGPYKVTEWISGTSLRLEKNGNYWQKKELRNVYAAQNVDVINFLVIKDPAQLAVGLQVGTIDIVGNLPALEAKRFEVGAESSKGFKVWDYTNRETQFMYLNQGSGSIFGKDLNLRKAVMYAMNIKGLIAGAAGGFGIPCKTFGNTLIVDYQKAWDTQPYFDFDLNSAKGYLAKSSYKGQSVRIMVSGNPMQASMAVLVQGFLWNVGINAEILTYENALFNTYKYDDKQWDIMFDQTSWSGPIPTQWRDKFDKRTFQNGKGGFISTSDAKFQSLLEAATNIATYSPKTVDEFHQYLKDQAYARGLFNQLSKSVTTDVVVKPMYHRIGVIFPSGCTYSWN